MRRYRIVLKPKAKLAAILPLVSQKAGDPSVLHALRHALKAENASQKLANGFDTIELVTPFHDAKNETLTLLFHLSSPNAADPSYRRKVKGQLHVRSTQKLSADEEQAVSAHLVISTKPVAPGVYRAVLEEVKGLSLTSISSLIRRILTGYGYPYLDKKKEEKETYSVFQAEGEKAESLTSALKKKSSLSYITLVRTNIPDAPDSEGIAEPKIERLKYKIIGDPRSEDWLKKFSSFISKAHIDWNDVYLEMQMDDEKHRTVKLEREKEAAEIMFVRSEQISLSQDADPCTMTVVPEIITKARSIMAKS